MRFSVCSAPSEVRLLLSSGAASLQAPNYLTEECFQMNPH